MDHHTIEVDEFLVNPSTPIEVLVQPLEYFTFNKSEIEFDNMMI